jgi:hypothetical protein
LSARLMNQPDDVCAQEIMRRVDKVCPGLVDDVEFVHVNRWDPILFVSWPGYYKELRRFRNSPQNVTSASDSPATISLFRA